jgi:type I restriction enzyme, S subunit
LGNKEVGGSRAYAIYNFDESVSVHYAYKYLIHFHRYFESVAVGATAKSLRLRHFQDLPIPIPPIKEQQRIVSILDEAFAAIAKAKANAEQNLLNANELFENAAQGIITQKGIDWEEKLLGEFATFRNGINYTKGSKGEKIKIVGVKDFQDSYWVPDKDLVEVSLDGKINETDLLKEGDILAVRSNGNPQLIGRTLLAGKINEKVTHSCRLPIFSTVQK